MMIWEGYNLSKGVNKNTYLILSELNCALVGWLDRREKEGGRESKGRECVANCWGIHAVGRVPTAGVLSPVGVGPGAIPDPTLIPPPIPSRHPQRAKEVVKKLVSTYLRSFSQAKSC